MKKRLVALLLLGSLPVAAQATYPALSFHRTPNSTFRVSHRLAARIEPAADSALALAAAVFNSQQFRDTLATFRFPCRNYHATHRCPLACARCQHRTVDTQTVLDSLYRLQNVGLTLHLDSLGGKSFGNSEYNVFRVDSHYLTVDEDTRMPFAYHYAVHLCHEYMHIRGFYHDRRLSRRVDIAEQTGEIAYVILLRWYRQGVKPF